MLKFFLPAPDPKELVRKWKSSLKSEERGIERQIFQLKQEEKKVQRSIKECAKRGDMNSAKASQAHTLLPGCAWILLRLPAAAWSHSGAVAYPSASRTFDCSPQHADHTLDLNHVLAKGVLDTRKAISRMYTNKAHLMDIGNTLTQQLAMLKVAGVMSKSTEVMKVVGETMKLPALQKTMMEMSKEMMKAGLIDEMMSDAMDSAMDTDEMEEETEAQVEAILAELAVEVALFIEVSETAQAKVAQQAAEDQAQEDDMDQLNARLNAVRS
ncbi:MAG: hypothetical protein WDW38_001652 [Sanguina aurantia]